MLVRPTPIIKENIVLLSFRKNQKYSLLAAVVMAGLAFSLAAPAQAYQCKNLFSRADATSPSADTARATARALWTHKVKTNYGLEWSVWDIAKQDTLSCAKTAGTWKCTAKAKPCLYVVP